MKKHMQFLFGIFVFILFLLIQSPTVSADVDGTASVINGLITQQQINQTQKAQFSDRNGASESIDPASGSLSWKQNQIHLPGREGLDLNIGIMYQQNYGFGWMNTFEAPGQLKKYNYLVSRYDLGMGWSFRFPSVQLADGGYKYYHSGEGSVYLIDFNATGTADSYTHLVGYQGKDLKFVQDTTGLFSNGQASSAYYLEYASKKREYFAADGRLLGIVDRYGNKLTFLHQDRTTYSGDPGKVITSITDTIGRTVSIDYESTLQSTSTFIGENITVTVKDPSGITVETVVYNKSRSQLILNGIPQNYSPVLSSITNQAGDTIYFDVAITGNALYSTNEKFDYYKKSFDSNSGYRATVLLTGVNYINSVVKYTYEKIKRNLGTSGAIEEMRVLNRYEQLKLNSGLGDVTNKVAYTYVGDYTGHPTYGDPNGLPSGYEFSSTATIESSTNTNGLITKSIFNGSQQPLSIENRTSGNERSITKNLSYDSTFKYLPTRVQIADYESSDTDLTANVLLVDSSYTSWGGLQSETLPLTQTQINNSTTKSKHTITYAYESTYYQLQSKTWYQKESDTTALSESSSYDSNGRQISTTNSLGEIVSTCYEVVAPNSTVTNSCVGQSNPLIGKVQKVTTLKNLGSGSASTTSTIFGASTNYAYPEEVQTLFTTTNDSNQPVTQTTKKAVTYYLGTGLLKDIKDAENRTTSYIYDALGRTLEIRYPDFTNASGTKYEVREIYSYSTVYDAANYDSTNDNKMALRINSYKSYKQLSNNTTTKMNERREYYSGDGYLLLDEVYNYDTSSWDYTQYHYDDLSRPNYVKDPMQNVTTVEYDKWGSQKEAKDPYGNLYVSEHQLKNRKSVSYFVASADVTAYRTTPTMATLKSRYVEQDQDAWGRTVTKRAYKNAALTQPITEIYTYDLVGNVLTYKDPKLNLNNEGVTKKYGYDALNRLIQVKDALNQLTNYVYNQSGNIKEINMMESASSSPVILNTKQYNEIGQVKERVDPSGLSDNYKYNNLGLQTKRIDRSGAVTVNQYDELNRPVDSTISGMGATQNIKYNYGSNGIRVDKATIYENGLFINSLENEVNRKNQITGIRSQSTDYTSNLSLAYDKNGRLIKQTNNTASFNVNYQYDTQRLSKVQLDGQSGVNSSNTVNAVYEYYPSGQVKSITYPPLSDGSILKMSYVYDNLNRVQSVTNTKGTSTLSSYTYAYDDNNNVQSLDEVVAGQPTRSATYSYDKLNRLSSITRGSVIVSYGYDLLGNRISVNDSSFYLGGETSYTYNLSDHLTNVTSGVSSTSFAYGANGLRYKKTSGSQTVQYHYDAKKNGQVISESNAANEITANYVRGDRLLMKKDKTTESEYYYLYNGHGDVVQMISTSGSVENRYQYDEWGNMVSQVEGTDNAFKYAGEIFDAETGLYYLRARYYDPTIGRFINEDSYEGQIDNPLSLNLYTYVYNNPLLYTDPSGHCAIGKDTGCYVNSQSGFDRYLNKAVYDEMAKSSVIWWDIERSKPSCEGDTTCLAEIENAQAELESHNDAYRNNPCSYTDCSMGQASFIFGYEGVEGVRLKVEIPSEDDSGILQGVGEYFLGSPAYANGTPSLPPTNVGPKTRYGYIEQYFPNDHGPIPHVHLIDSNGKRVKVGQNGKPTSDAEAKKFTHEHAKLVSINLSYIRKAVGKIMNYYSRFPEQRKP